MWTKLDTWFNSAILTVLTIIKLDGLYKNNPTFRKFVKYGSWITLEYWLVKGPLTIAFTNLLGLWYVVSAFMAGLICTLIGFVLSNWWVFRHDTV